MFAIILKFYYGQLLKNEEITVILMTLNIQHIVDNRHTL